MNFLTRRDPFQEFKTLQNRLFEPFFGRFDFLSDDLGNGTWAPPVDVSEENDRIVVRAEIPGMSEKDIRIQYEDGLLTLSGERTFERKDTQNYHRIERAYGTFSRSFSLPRSVDGGKIQANYTNGILEIVIPKREESKPRQIEIAVNEPSRQINA